MLGLFRTHRYSKIAFIVAVVLLVAGLLLRQWVLIRIAALALVVSAGFSVLESGGTRMGGR